MTYPPRWRRVELAVFAAILAACVTAPAAYLLGVTEARHDLPLECLADARYAPRGPVAGARP